jgi:hypothetical protein
MARRISFILAVWLGLLLASMSWQASPALAGFTPTPRPPATPIPPTTEPQPPAKEPKDTPVPTPTINLTATPAVLPPGGAPSQLVYGGLALALWCAALVIASAAAKRI